MVEKSEKIQTNRPNCIPIYFVSIFLWVRGAILLMSGPFPSAQENKWSGRMAESQWPNGKSERGERISKTYKLNGFAWRVVDFLVSSTECPNVPQLHVIEAAIIVCVSSGNNRIDGGAMT